MGPACEVIGTMLILRHDRFRVTAALFAAVALLFVSTASMACEAPVDQDMASMSMNDDSGPCEQKTVKASCQKACLVFCQSLIPRGDSSPPARLYAPVRYSSLNAPHADFTLEADDPPPRT